MNNIRLLKRKEIDEDKWNQCIALSSNSLPYAFSWYLDIVAENWDALVLGDYETVMPLVWLRKFGIKCLYQPYYCQQLGVFGKHLSKEVQKDFLNYATKKFSYISINLNSGAGNISAEYNLSSKKNLLLNLNEDYSILKKEFSENHIRNIRKAEKAQIFFSVKTGVTHFQKFYLANVDRKKENFKNKHEKIFKQLTKTVIENETAQILSAADKTGKLLAASLIIRHQKRLINIINTSSAEGKNTGASHFLFDNIIRQFSPSETTLDFEGSSNPGIARFYQGFGAYEETFYNYHTSIVANPKQRFF